MTSCSGVNAGNHGVLESQGGAGSSFWRICHSPHCSSSSFLSSPSLSYLVRHRASVAETYRLHWCVRGGGSRLRPIHKKTIHAKTPGDRPAVTQSPRAVTRLPRWSRKRSLSIDHSPEHSHECEQCFACDSLNTGLPRRRRPRRPCSFDRSCPFLFAGRGYLPLPSRPTTASLRLLDSFNPPLKPAKYQLRQ